MTAHDHDTDDIGAAISAAAQRVHAPDGLRARIDADRARAARRRRPARTWRPVLAGAGLALAVVVVALAVLVGGGGGAPGSAAPTVADAALAALRPSTGPAPAVDPRHRTLLRAGVGGVRFPEWEYAFRWHAAGVRHDRLNGRGATTVSYDGPGGTRLGYAIVEAPALDVPAGGGVVQRAGVRYTVLRRGGATIVTWRRGDHTCVLAAHGVPANRLVALAAWRAGAAA
jgi:hypothetical protein